MINDGWFVYQNPEMFIHTQFVIVLIRLVVAVMMATMISYRRTARFVLKRVSGKIGFSHLALGQTGAQVDDVHDIGGVVLRKRVFALRLSHLFDGFQSSK